VSDLGAACARQPDIPVVLPAIQITAPLMFSGERDQGVEHVRHGARRLSRSRLFCLSDPAYTRAHAL
jgi:hypothetical protein